jgi:bis(5'-nucleosyl)-tetraphosphatase (symmetrical)
MALYMIGDVQGCWDALQRLLDKIGFSASRDTVYLLGDLVNRGPDSLSVLRFAKQGGSSVRCILGNHDLHLLTVAHGLRKPHRKDTLADVLAAPDAPALLHWLRQQPLARYEHGWLMVHAGVLPQWNLEKTIALNAEYQSVMSSSDYMSFLSVMYGNEPKRWKKGLIGADRLRVIVNAMTRLRFCDDKGRMEFDTKDDIAAAPEGYMPWFDVPERKTAGIPIAFGHWSTLRDVQRPDVLALDSGCVWGGCLSAAVLRPLAVGESSHVLPVVQVSCPQTLDPSTF